MRPEGPWQRLAAALADSSLFYLPLYDRILSPTTMGYTGATHPSPVHSPIPPSIHHTPANKTNKSGRNKPGSDQDEKAMDIRWNSKLILLAMVVQLLLACTLCGLSSPLYPSLSLLC